MAILCLEIILNLLISNDNNLYCIYIYLPTWTIIFTGSPVTNNKDNLVYNERKRSIIISQYFIQKERTREKDE